MARPTNTELVDAQMRERLAAAALALFRRSGVEGVSLRKLAVQVGVSHTMLYRYFASKEALLDAVRMATLRELHASLIDADDRANDALSRIRTAAQALIRFGVAFPREYRFLFSAEPSQLVQNDELLKLRHQVFDHIVDIAKVAHRQQLITMEARTWVHMAWALLHGLLTLHESNQLLEGRSFDDLANAAVEVLLGGAQAAPPAVGRKRAR